MTNQAWMREAPVEQRDVLWFASVICMSFLWCLWNVQNDKVFKRPADSAWKMWKTSRLETYYVQLACIFYIFFLHFLLMQTFAWRQNLCFLKSSSAPAAYWPCYARTQQNLCYTFSKAVYERWLTEDCFLCCVLLFCLRWEKENSS